MARAWDKEKSLEDKRLLIATLEELKEKEFHRFKWELPQVDIPKGFPAMKTGKLEKAEKEDTVDELVQTYKQHAVEVTQKALTRINRNDLVQILSDSSLRLQEDTQLPNVPGSVQTVRKHKVELTDCLRAEPLRIMQYVDARSIIRDDQYQRVMNIPQPEDQVIYLLDRLIDNGEESCSAFLELLKNADVLDTYPQLRRMDLSI